MSKKTLLLDATYQVLACSPERKAFKLLCKENKVEVLSQWDEIINFGAQKIHHPSILKLTHQVKRVFNKTNFSRKAVVKRDKSKCMYCDKKLTASEITIDHVLPKSKGGTTSFNNCVVSCKPCNSKKADKTLEETGMKLIKKPVHPSFSECFILVDHPEDYWHNDWDTYIYY